jgi:hypothetical protein
VLMFAKRALTAAAIAHRATEDTALVVHARVLMALVRTHSASPKGRRSAVLAFGHLIPPKVSKAPNA